MQIGIRWDDIKSQLLVQIAAKLPYYVYTDTLLTPASDLGKTSTYYYLIDMMGALSYKYKSVVLSQNNEVCG